ncbi:MAG: hypothetical protein JWP93_37 [Polaromonas sp.]|jgi:hypothetical protein|nr:hypothetical protein [Polaromonas sp.]
MSASKRTSWRSGVPVGVAAHGGDTLGEGNGNGNGNGEAGASSSTPSPRHMP